MLPENLFRALSDETRLRCVVLLQREGELCVCELTYALQLAQPKISRHLANLKAAQVVLDRRTGTWVHYQLNPTLPTWFQQNIAHAASALQQQTPYCDDHQRLMTMTNRPQLACET